MAIVDAALELQSLGLSVFPLTARGKKPIVESWAPYQEHCAPADVVAKWWGEYPDANVAVACGPVSGVLVLDVDGDVGCEALATLEAKHGALPETWRSLTGKGKHYWFYYPPGRSIGNSAKKLGAGLDTRGQGGYVVGPGSVHENGKEYRWDVPPGAAELADCPPWLLTIIDPPPAPARLVVDNGNGQQRDRGGDDAREKYLDSAIAGERGSVEAAPEGTRNDALNMAAFSLGQLVGGGELDADYVRQTLLTAALNVGLTQKEALTTIESGLSKGRLKPRTVPQRERQGYRQNGAEPPPHGEKKEPGIIRLVSASGILLDNGPPYLCKGLIHRGDMSVLYGQSGCGKTFLALYIAHAIATGRPIFNRRVRRAAVALFALEGSSGLAKRLVAIQERHGQAADLFVHRTPLTLFQNTPIMLEMIEAVKAVNAGLVIFDTLSRTMAGANENAPEDMTAMVGMFDIIRAKTGAHVMLVHHSGKNEALGARGHSSLRAAVEVEMEVAASESGSRTMAVTKGRDDADGKVISFELEPIELGKDDDGDAIETCVVEEAGAAAPDRPRAKPPKLTAAQAMLLKVLSGLPQIVSPTHEDWVVPVDGMARVVAVTRKTLIAALQKKVFFDAGTGTPLTSRDRSRLRDTLSSLEQKGLICSNDLWVWKP